MMAALRAQLQARRRALNAEQRESAALAVSAHVTAWSGWQTAAHIAGYWACRGELDPRPLLEQAWSAGRSVYLPVLHGEHGLRFAHYTPETPVRLNRFRIPEPEVSSSDWVDPGRLDLVLTPLVAFDLHGSRLGMGGGFYDRAFAEVQDPAWCGHRPVLLGLGYAFQQVATVPRQPWDVPLDAVATEQALHHCCGAAPSLL